MEPILAALVLALLALLGARYSFSTESVPAGPRLLLRTGTHFLFLGFLLGSHGLGILPPEIVEQLNPLLAIGLGWISFLFGLQLDRGQLEHFPRGFLSVAVGQAVVAFFLFLGSGWAVLAALDRTGPTVELLLLGAAATACVSTPAGIALVSATLMVRGPVHRLLFFIASVDAVVGITALQVAYALYHPTELVGGLPGLAQPWWIAVAVGLGVVGGILFLWLTRPKPGKEELVLFLLGIATFLAGTALYLRLSPLFVGMVAGVVVANFSPDRQRLHDALQSWEKPIYIVLLLLAGAILEFPTAWVVPLGVGYAVLRLGSKTVGAWTATRFVPRDRRPPPLYGLGLAPQGGISLAMVVSGVLTYSGLTLNGLDAVEILFGTVVLGVTLSELAGPVLTRSVLRRAGEISRDVEDALAAGDERKARVEAIRHTPGPEDDGDGGDGEGPPAG